MHQCCLSCIQYSEVIPACAPGTSSYWWVQMLFGVWHFGLLLSITLHQRRQCDLYTNKQKRNGGLSRPVAPLMLESRGAVHQPVNSLPSGWPSISPLYGISHLNNPFSLPCSSLSPSPLCSVSSVPVLLSSAHSPAFDHVSLLWPEESAVIPLLFHLPLHPHPSHYSPVHPESPWHLWNCLCFRVLI